MMNFNKFSEVLCKSVPAEKNDAIASKGEGCCGKWGRLWLQLWAVVPAMVLGYHLLQNEASAQVIPDGSLPTEVVPNGNNFTINEGARAGGNLFHSFEEFSVPTGGRAFFDNDMDVDNIFSRVTGGNISNIDGLIRANGTANLFLLNPAGIVFGPNARLDIGGSFFGSTASGLMFPDGMEFNATEQTTPLLTINAPIGLRFRGDEGNIVSESVVLDDGIERFSVLEVNSGETLGLVGGDINLDGTFIRAPGGRIELGGLAAAGSVGFRDDGSLIFPDGVDRGNISLTNFSVINVRDGVGGAIDINADNLDILERSVLLSGIVFTEIVGSGTPNNSNNRAGNITLNATGTIAINNSGVANQVQEGTIGNAGDINIKARNLFLTNESELNASTFSEGNAGRIKIEADEEVMIENGFIFNDVKLTARGNAGGIEINTGNLSVIKGSELVSIILGQGNVGSVTITTNDTVAFDEGSVFSTVEMLAEGNTGGINITTGSLFVTNDSQLNANTLGKGNAGIITINASDTVTFDRGFALTGVGSQAEGNSGGIDIMSESLFIINGAQLETSTLGQGNAGKVEIFAKGAVRIEDGNILSLVRRGGVGEGGDIVISSESLSLVGEDAGLDASTFGIGNPGSVTISALGEVKLESGDIFSNIETGAVGEGGNINIQASSLSVNSGTQLQTIVRGENQDSSAGQGIAGDINIIVDEDVTFAGNGTSAFSVLGSGSEGNSGNIRITAGSLLLTDGTSLEATTLGQGNAGDITINVEGEARLEGTSIFSNVEAGAVGNSGKIEIQAGSLFLIDGAQLQTLVRAENQESLAGQGIAGDINITVDEDVVFKGIDNQDFPSGAFSNVETGAIGQGGDINITARSVSITEDARLQTSSAGQAGDIGQADAGNIQINANSSFLLLNGAVLSSRAFGQGDAGTVSVQVPQGTVFLEDSDIFSSVQIGGVGNGGDININARSLFVTKGAQLSSDTFGEGNAGIVSITATDLVELSGRGTSVFSDVNQNAIGDAGGILIETGSLSVKEGVLLSSSTLGQGDAGSVIIEADGEVRLESGGIFSTVETGARGEGGNISIKANSLFIENSGIVSTGTSGQGDTGNISVQIENLISLSEGSQIRNVVEGGGVGNSRDINITAQSLSLTDGSIITAGVFGQEGDTPGGQGEAGSILINTSDSVNISGFNNERGFSSGLFASTGRGAVGVGGNIIVNTGAFRLTDGAVVNASTQNESNSGDITINARTFEVINGGQVQAITESTGNAGSIDINVANHVSLSGIRARFSELLDQFGEDIVGNISANGASGLFASTEAESTGQGGNLTVQTGDLLVQDGAIVTVSAQGTGAAGNLVVDANQIRLDNGTLRANTSSGNQGNIFIGEPTDLTEAQRQQLDLPNFEFDLRNIELRNNSNIEANASGDATGGNIFINTDFLIAFPEGDNNITADAQAGSGGMVTINADGVLGIEFRDDPTGLNDITARSESGQQGTVEFNTPNTDLRQGLAELSENVIEVETIVARACPSDRPGEGSVFVITGRGGLPPSPDDPLTDDTIRVEGKIVPAPTLADYPDTPQPLAQDEPTEPIDTNTIQPARGWYVNEKGVVVLTAEPIQPTFVRYVNPLEGCPGQKE